MNLSAGVETPVVNLSWFLAFPRRGIFSRSVPHPMRNLVLNSLVITSRHGVKEYASTMPSVLA
jgi:hypothetical protein